MIKFTGMAAVMLMSICCTVLAAAENLLPAVREAKGFWYQARNSEASVRYSCDEKTGTFKLESANETGYVNYRCDLKLAPGTYTIDLLASGSCDKKAAVGLEVYSFNAQGKARAISMNYFTEGKFDSERKVATFVVPSDSVSQRFGLCLNYKGRVEFVKPALYKGKLAEGDLPPRKDMKKSNKLVANHNTWVADWVWVKNANSISKASFIKKFTVDKPIVAAMVQLTADNGYELKVNDQFVGADGDWKTVEKYDIASLLKKGENSIELIGENFDGVGAVLLQGQLWFADGSTLDLLTGPDWDLYIQGKLANEEKVIIGKFPIEPWTLLPFERLAPMESIALPVIKSVDKVAAGEIFTLKLGDADKIPTKELNDLRLIFTDEKNMPAVVSQHFKPFIRRERTTLYMDLELSLYAQPGTYRWKIEGLTKEILASGIEQKLTVLPPKEAIPGNPGTLLPRFDGKNTMQTAAGEMALFTYATVLPEPQRYYNWQHTGGHMYEVGFSAGKMLPDGSVDISATEQTMMQILSGDPNAGVYIRLRIDVPGWWNARNPDEVFVSDKGRRALQSFCSDKWMSDMHDAIAKVVDGLAARPVGKALSGVLVMGFRGGEFQLWGEDVGEYDCSKPAQKAFTQWQQERGYKDIITLPNPALSWPFRYQKGDAEIRERFFSFVADRHADNMISLAKFFKNRYGGKYGFGLYYGYAQEHGGSWKRMLYGGHLGFRKVIEQAPLDLLSCPASYGLRPFHRSHAFMYQPDSAALFGIRSIIENDIRPYAHPLAGDSSGTTVYSMADSLVNDSRLSLFAACHGAVVRYLALGEIVDWFGPLPSINQIRKDNLRNMQLQPAPLGEAGQLAWAIDTASWVKAADMNFTEKKWEEFACLSRDTVMRSGRSVAFVTVDDLINYPGKWQIVAIPAPALLPKDKVAALEKQYGKLPQLPSDTGALVIINGKKTLANTRNELWQAIATPAALKAGINTVWYVGGNFVGTWDGKALNVSAR